MINNNLLQVMKMYDSRHLQKRHKFMQACNCIIIFIVKLEKLMNSKILFAGYFIAAALFFSCTKDSASSEKATTDSSSGYASVRSSSSSGGGQGGNASGVITAGEWNDLAHWDFWKTLLLKDTIKQIPSIWGIYPKNKVVLFLKDINNNPITDAKITMQYGGNTVISKTDNFGNAVLFAGLYEANSILTNFTLQANYNGQVFNIGSFLNDGATIYKSIPVNKIATKTLDILFAVDATGSMGDEISYLKREILDVINRSGAQLPGVQINMGSIFYRDFGDEYVVRSFPFTSVKQQLVNFINLQQAEGGGDFPEAVDEALIEATQNMQWSSNAVNRLLFLILDAPPHKEQVNVEKLKTAIKTAQEKGIRIIPISASGINRETEILLRSLSISTNSTYVFITNDSGIGNPHLTPTVGNYTVEFLNNLMVRLITKYGKN